MKRPRLVLVEWLDSHAGSHWEVLPIEPTALVIQSVGWVVATGDGVTVLVPHRSRADTPITPQACGAMHIPTAAIVRIRTLKEPTR